MDKMYDVYPHYEKIAAEKKARQWISRIIPLHVWYLLRSELAIMKRYFKFKKVKKALRDKKDIKLNIAPGNNSFRDWINIDINDGYPGVDYAYDCRKEIPCSDNSVTAIYSEHFFEHIEYSEEAPRFVRECHRVLVDGGIVRLVVPDGRKCLEAYVSNDPAKIENFIGGDPWFEGKWTTPMELVNLVFRQGNEHKFTYDYETLFKLFTFYGFHVEKKQFNESSIPGFVSDSERRVSYSLYIEARK